MKDGEGGKKTQLQPSQLHQHKWGRWALIPAARGGGRGVERGAEEEEEERDGGTVMMSADSCGGEVSGPGGKGRGEQRRGSGAQAAVGGATLPPVIAKEAGSCCEWRSAARR